MVGYLISHLSGNLRVFLPDPEPGVADIDLYAEALRTLGQPFVPRVGVLWVVRGILIASLVLHVICVVQLAARSRAARPTRYRGQRYLGATLPARLMLTSGLLLLAYIIFHILHFTTGTEESQGEIKMEVIPISPDAVPAALEKAEHYRLLNEPEEAESICVDVLEVEPDDQQAFAMEEYKQANGDTRTALPIPRTESTSESSRGS